MKKTMKNVAILVMAAAALSACGGSANSGASNTKLEGSFIASEKTAGSYGDGSFVASVYQVNLFKGNVYQMIKTELSYGYSMVLGTTSVITYGTFVKGTAEDGIAPYTLNAASEVIVNSYSKAGGYNIGINTQNATYPVEMLAKTQGEKNMANSKEDVLAEYGKGYVVYAEEAKNTFSFIKEGASAAEEVTTKSGSVKSILNEVYTSSNLVNVFVTPGAYGDGSWNGSVIQVNRTDKNNYEYIKTEISFGYSMLLGTTTIVNYGKAECGNTEDGYTPVTLKNADRVIMNSFSKAGGYNIQIDTLDCQYPVEMLAKTQGEKNMANSKEDVVREYGAEQTVYASSTNNNLSLTNPNA